ncbi:MAG: hypothetical protein HOP29_03215 [Phycisphaerales bacterium]|nr:hypothetical protein [Phycisphaerales bacterium]
MTGGNDRRVVITGVGPVTSIGIGAGPFWQALRAGRSVVEPRQLHLDFGKEVQIPMASMPPALPIIKPHHEFLERQDYAGYRDLAYALAAIDLAIEDARLTYDRANNTIGSIQAFEAPGMERAVVGLFETCATLSPDKPPQVYEALAPQYYNTQGFLYVHVMGKAFGFHGFSTSVHNACSSGMYAIELAAQRIRCGETDVMIVAGGEAFDTAVRIEWFRQLGLYAADATMRPFDAQSTGFYVGEGAGALVLESLSSAERRGATPYAEYVGGRFAQQGWKHSIPDVRANRLAGVIASTLESTGTSPESIDLIVPHGASTPTSDGYEAVSLKTSLNGRAKNAVATVLKPHVGHMLAASAIVELIGSLQAMRHGCVPATLNSRPTSGKLPVPLATETIEKEVRTLLKVSTGFTGHDAAAVFRRVD